MIRYPQRLEGCHPELIRVVSAFAKVSPYDVLVVEGLRSLERQKELVASGASRTLNSRHLTGHAVDLAPFIDGKVSWDWDHYRKWAPVMKAIARSEGVMLEWGGDWATFPDGPHWQLNAVLYPAKEASKCSAS